MSILILLLGENGTRMTICIFEQSEFISARSTATGVLSIGKNGFFGGIRVITFFGLFFHPSGVLFCRILLKTQ